ncbi:methyltransferase domain-containing protein [Roseivivax marinus]|uniref:class I SAM-dependent methyltransferase n=1 Tax=Roseivivax marinus TaxID=1379903 RepID=UPI001F039901|nr:class I SAM-dependent methyltransferase [Roseivivax marinus]UMA63359.1 methyltransferase domain-containing protein [Roseivivax marinus]
MSPRCSCTSVTTPRTSTRRRRTRSGTHDRTQRRHGRGLGRRHGPPLGAPRRGSRAAAPGDSRGAARPGRCAARRARARRGLRLWRALSRAAAEAAGPNGAVLGLDLSEPLLELARAQGGEGIEYLRADAQVADLGEGRFDTVLSRFGVMFFDNPVAAFSNLARSLVPGGRMIFATWAEADANPWFGAPRRAAVARLGAVAPSDPDAPGPMAFRNPDRVLGILNRSGLSGAQVETLETELHHPDGWDAMERMLPDLGPIPGVMREHGGTAEDLAAIMAALRGEWDRYIGPDGIRLPARVHLYSAEAAT